MTAKEFWAGFSTILKENIDELKNSWHSNKEYTNKILEKIDAFLEKTGIPAQREYYNIDLIGWKQLKGENRKLYQVSDLEDKQFENYLWDLEVAVEHENSSVSWMDEVVKLLHINCPLRVVIGYLPINKKDSNEKYLDAITARIKKTKVVENESAFNCGEFLIIIGDSKCGEDQNKYCNYKGYVFNPTTNKFIDIDKFN